MFEVASGVQLVLAGLTIEYGNGRYGGFDPNINDGKGGGILNWGTLTVSNCTVSGNNDTGGGVEALDLGGGISNAGTLTLSGSTVKGNSAGYGGGISNDTTGILTVLNSTLTGNWPQDVYNLGPWSQQGSKIGRVGP